MLPLYTCRRSKRHQSSSPWTTNYPSRCATAMPMVPLDAYDQGASNAPSCEWNSAVSLSLSKVRSQNPPNPPFPDFFAGFFLFCRVFPHGAIKPRHILKSRLLKNKRNLGLRVSTNYTCKLRSLTKTRKTRPKLIFLSVEVWRGVRGEK